jgi:ligand-binding SRPBCC domain-containing protein
VFPLKTSTLETELWLPRPREEVFAFFADAVNLELITPPWLRFQILSPLPIAMRQGALIDYRLRLRGVPLGWQTQISVWEPPLRFVDAQLRGPYRRWVHEHLFEESDGGTLCRDRVEYAVPGGWLVERLLVRPDLDRIFAYRRERLKKILSPSASMAL